MTMSQGRETPYATYRLRENAAHNAARLAFQKPRTSFGAACHWVKMAGVLAPVVIGEFIQDPVKKWRAVRAVSVASALILEGMWEHKIAKDTRSRA
jgi:hypothetical protein